MYTIFVSFERCTISTKTCEERPTNAIRYFHDRCFRRFKPFLSSPCAYDIHFHVCHIIYDRNKRYRMEAIRAGWIMIKKNIGRLSHISQIQLELKKRKKNRSTLERVTNIPRSILYPSFISTKCPDVYTSRFHDTLEVLNEIRSKIDYWFGWVYKVWKLHFWYSIHCVHPNCTSILQVMMMKTGNNK